MEVNDVSFLRKIFKRKRAHSVLKKKFHEEPVPEEPENITPEGSDEVET